jgi:hypothetical protein
MRTLPDLDPRTVGDEPVNLVEFLLARLADDERIALEVIGAMGTGDGPAPYVDERGRLVLGDVGLAAPVTAHMLRHSPNRVLAEAAAKRALIQRIENLELTGVIPVVRDSVAGRIWALRILAQPYADHADFDPAWRIEEGV